MTEDGKAYPKPDRIKQGFARLTATRAAASGAPSAAHPSHLSRRHMPDQNNGQNVGKLIEIKGVVIDAVFPDKLPEIYSALRIARPDGAAT